MLDEINRLAREDALVKGGELRGNVGARQVAGLPARRDAVVYTPPSEYSQESTAVSTDGEGSLTVRTTYSEDPFPAHLRGKALPSTSSWSSENPLSKKRPSGRCREFETTSQEDSSSVSTKYSLAMFKHPSAREKLKCHKPQTKIPVGDPLHFELNLQRMLGVSRPAAPAAGPEADQRKRSFANLLKLSDEDSYSVWPSSNGTTGYRTPPDALTKDNASVDTLADLPFVTDLEARPATSDEFENRSEQTALRNSARPQDTEEAVGDDLGTVSQNSPVVSRETCLETLGGFETAPQNTVLSVSPSDTGTVLKGVLEKHPANERNSHRELFHSVVENSPPEPIDISAHTSELQNRLRFPIASDKDNSERERQVQACPSSKVFLSSDDFLVIREDIIKASKAVDNETRAEAKSELRPEKSIAQKDNLSNFLALLRTTSDNICDPRFASSDNAVIDTPSIVEQGSLEEGLFMDAQENPYHLQHSETIRESPVSAVPSFTSADSLGSNIDQACEMTDEIVAVSGLPSESCVRDNPRKRNVENEETDEPMRKIAYLETNNIDLCEYVETVSQETLHSETPTSAHPDSDSGWIKRRSVFLDCSIAGLFAVSSPRRNEDRRSSPSCYSESKEEGEPSDFLEGESTEETKLVGGNNEPSEEVRTRMISVMESTEESDLDCFNHESREEVETSRMSQSESTEETNRAPGNNKSSEEVENSMNLEMTGETHLVYGNYQVREGGSMEGRNVVGHDNGTLAAGITNDKGDAKERNIGTEDDSPKDVQSPFEIPFSSSGDRSLAAAYDLAMSERNKPGMPEAEAVLRNSENPRQDDHLTQEWEQRLDDLGRKYLVHLRTGVIRFEQDSRQSFTMEKR